MKFGLNFPKMSLYKYVSKHALLKAVLGWFADRLKYQWGLLTNMSLYDWHFWQTVFLPLKKDVLTLRGSPAVGQVVLIWLKILPGVWWWYFLSKINSVGMRGILKRIPLKLRCHTQTKILLHGGEQQSSHIYIIYAFMSVICWQLYFQWEKNYHQTFPFQMPTKD